MESSRRKTDVLKDVVAFVEVWSSNRKENYSKTFMQQLQDMGAMVAKSFSKQVTHVVFKDGFQSTWKKAKNAGAKLVSVLWVERCREAGAHVDESLFPAINEHEGIPENFLKRHRCMQPKDFIEKSPENDKRLQRKFDKMVKDLEAQKAAVGAEIPVLMFGEEDSIIYSPCIAEQSKAMEKRLKEMIEKRENLSPTEEQVKDQLNTSYDDVFGTSEGKSETTRLLTNVCKRTQQTFECTPVIPTTDCDIEMRKKNKINCQVNCGDVTVAAKNGKCGKKSRHKVKLSTNVKGESVSTASTVKKESQSNDFYLKQKTVEYGLENNAADLSNYSLIDSVKSNSDVGSPILEKKCSSKSREKREQQSHLSPLSSTVEKLAISEDGIAQLIGIPSKCLDSLLSREETSLYEDYFSPTNLKENQKMMRRASVGLLPQKSPSPPLLCLEKQMQRHKKRKQLADTDKPDDTNCRKRARSIGNILSDNEHYLEETKKSKIVQKLFFDCIDTRATPEVCESRTSVRENVSFHSPTDKTVSKDCLEKCDELKCLHPRGPLAEEPNVVEKRNNNRCLKSVALAELEPVESLKPFGKLNYTKGEGQLDVVKHKGPASVSTCGTSTEKPAGKKQDNHLPTTVQSSENETSCCDTQKKSKEIDQAHRCDLESKKTRKIKKPSKTLVMTSMPSEKQNMVIQVVQKLGGFSFSDNVCESTTHVVAGSIRRTLNIIFGIARGCWILSYDWVLCSLENGHWIPEEPYELSDHFLAAPICRLQRHLSAGEHQQTLFGSQPLMFISPVSQPPCNSLRELILLCGGKVCKSLRQAGICIGEYNGKKVPETKYLSEQWILDCITQHKTCPIEKYVLQ
nr:PREDICTED: microcephalin isoform X2 [Latimeria chalumnae]|eukprot:XP_014349238.1 PREDICTED: microcephalin isoform X2 [Latimeria chalumnae]